MIRFSKKHGIMTILLFIVFESAFPLAAADNAASLAVRRTARVTRTVARNADDLARLGVRYADDIMRTGTLRSGDIARVSTRHSYTVARLGLREGDAVIHNFSNIHLRAHTARRVANIADDVGFTGMSNTVLRNKRFVTTTGEIMDGNIIRRDLTAFSTAQYRDIIAAKMGQPLSRNSGVVNGIRYTGDAYRQALIARYDRISDFLNLHSLGRRADLLNGWNGTPAELAAKYNIRLGGRESHRQIARRIAQNGRTDNNSMISTIMDGTENAVVRAQNYALFPPDRAMPGRNIPIFRRIEGTADTRGFNMTNQAHSHFREPGYFLAAGGLRTEVVSARARTTTRDGLIKRYIEVIERVIP